MTRVSGFAAMLGGILLVAADSIGLFTGKSSDVYTGEVTDQISAILFLAGKVLVVIGIIGIYLYHSEKAGTFGLIAFLLAFSGSTMMIGSDWSEVFIAPVLQQDLSLVSF